MRAFGLAAAVVGFIMGYFKVYPAAGTSFFGWQTSCALKNRPSRTAGKI
jgi:hypothetical protein